MLLALWDRVEMHNLSQVLMLGTSWDMCKTSLKIIKTSKNNINFI